MGRKKLGMFRIRFKLLDRMLLTGMSLTVVVALVIFNAYTNNAEKNQINFVQLVMEKTSMNQKKQFEDFVDEKIGVLRTLATYPEIYEMNPKEQEVFIGSRAENLGFRHIFVMDMNGIGYYFEEGVTRNQHSEVFLPM